METKDKIRAIKNELVAINKKEKPHQGTISHSSMRRDYLQLTRKLAKAPKDDRQFWLINNYVNKYTDKLCISGIKGTVKPEFD